MRPSPTPDGVGRRKYLLPLLVSLVVCFFADRSPVTRPPLSDPIQRGLLWSRARLYRRTKGRTGPMLCGFPFIHGGVAVSLVRPPAYLSGQLLPNGVYTNPVGFGIKIKKKLLPGVYTVYTCCPRSCPGSFRLLLCCLCQ